MSGKPIEYDRATGSRVDQRIDALIASEAELVVTEPVLMEVSPGARTAQAADSLWQLMLRAGLLSFDARSDFDAAAIIYRRCREAGSSSGPINRCGVVIQQREIQRSSLAHLGS